MRDYIEQLNECHSYLFDDFYVEDETEYDFFKKYLKTQSLPDQKNGVAQTYLYIHEEDNGNKSIQGFYSLRASSLIIEKDDFVKEGSPAIEIYELAVKKPKQRKGIGRKLMEDAIATILNIAELIGVQHVLVCATESAVGYYKRFNFSKIPGHKDVPRDTREGSSNSGCTAMSLPIAIKE